MAYSSSSRARTPSSAPMLSHVTQAPFSLRTQFSTQPWSRQTMHRRSRRAGLLQRGQCWRPSGFATGDLPVHVVLPTPPAEPGRFGCIRRPVPAGPRHGLVLQRSHAARAWGASPVDHVGAVDLEPLQSQPVRHHRREVDKGRPLLDDRRRPDLPPLRRRDRAHPLESNDALLVQKLLQPSAHVSPATQRCRRRAAPPEGGRMWH